MKKLITVATLLLLIATSLIPQLGCDKSDNGTGLQTTTTIHAIDWVNFIKFNDIIYLSKRGTEVSFAEEDLYYFDEVKFKVADNVDDPKYRSKNGDASFLEEGTLIYSIRGYSSDFRLLAKAGTEMILYEADTNPSAKKGVDLLDISGKVEYIGVNGAILV